MPSCHVLRARPMVEFRKRANTWHTDSCGIGPVTSGTVESVTESGTKRDKKGTIHCIFCIFHLRSYLGHKMPRPTNAPPPQCEHLLQRRCWTSKCLIGINGQCGGVLKESQAFFFALSRNATELLQPSGNCASIVGAISNAISSMRKIHVQWRSSLD